MKCLIFALLSLTAFKLAAADKVTSRNFYVEPPTLISLGFEWQIEGDDNRNASVAVSWRKKGDQAWHEGLPFLRIGNERLNENALQFVTPNMFAGSIFDLDPGTEYECRFVLSDPDGVAGKSENMVTVRTRSEPKPAEGGRSLSRLSRRLQGRETAAGLYRIDGGVQHRRHAFR